MKQNLVYNKAFKFSIRIIKLYQFLRNNKHEYILSKQIIRSGTSIGSNIKEATQAQSKKDFLNKINIALKETVETEYWLELMKESNFVSEESFKSIYEECKELYRILSSIVKTTKDNIKNNR